VAGFYKRNQGQLIRTLSAIGMALVLGGVSWFVYDLMVHFFPRQDAIRAVDFAAVVPGQFELAQRWPGEDQADAEVFATGTIVTTDVKDQMDQFYGRNQHLRREVLVRSTTGVAHARWIQVGVPTVLFVAGAAFIFFLVNKPRFADFLIATEGEMKKVSWSNRQELIGSTTIVIVTVVILGVFIALSDYGIVALLRAINVH
jgi:preprotein translocase SecE subunit